MKEKQEKKFKWGFIIWIAIFVFALVRKTLQNDTFYTIKVGESILKNGIDMLDHFSWHEGLAYTYPHWLYDIFIYLIYKTFGFAGLYGSTIILLFILLVLVFKINYKNTNSYIISAFATFLCGLSISGFATARAQMVSFILFALELLFIENFLRNGKKSNLIGLIIISILICNIHPAVWPFYFILYLPYLVEYIISAICEKIKVKKKNKFIKFLSSKFILEKNKNIKYLFLTMILCIFTGLLTPIGDTPYTYMIKTMQGNSQSYIMEHQMMTWKSSPFTIIIAFETIILALLSKTKLRDLFMILGISFMSIISVRHISLLALIGTICFARIFLAFLNEFGFNLDKTFMKLFSKKIIVILSYLIVIIFAIFMFKYWSKQEYIDKKLYPTEAVKYIKKNLDIKKIKLYNEYNFGSYLLLNDIPVFIDSRCDLYTKQFSGLDYDMFDDFEFMANNYMEKFEFYGITHVLIYKNNGLYNQLKTDKNYRMLYEDEYFILYEKTGKGNNFVITFG